MSNYLPLKLGFRFSTNAVVPSLKSSVPKALPKASISASKPFFPSTNPALIASIAKPIAVGEFLEILVAIFYAVSISISGDTQWFTKPISCALAP